jgi:hypothetical protein
MKHSYKVTVVDEEPLFGIFNCPWEYRFDGELPIEEFAKELIAEGFRETGHPHKWIMPAAILSIEEITKP